MSLLSELQRRKVFRVAIGYTISAWLIAQVADLVADNFNAPDWVMQMTIALLVAGLPVSLLLSWAFDLTTAGVTRTGHGDTEDSLVVSNWAVLALVVSIFVALVVVFYLAWPRDDRSIAVLPFEDISPNADQAYLGHGIADELRLELQHLAGLRVAGRTSSNAYAQQDSKTIGEILAVESILEGSVRKEGDNVRVTVQLIDVADGFTIWSQSYNRKLEKIFEMQKDIATSVAGSLGVRLGVGSVNAFHGAGTQNVEAYESYLLAQNKDYSPEGVKEAMPLLEQAVKIDPNYAVAWSTLALRELSFTFDVAVQEIPQVVARANTLAVRAVQLDPQSAASQSTLALVQMNNYDWVGSEQSHTRAIELLQDRPMADRYGIMLSRSGRATAALKQFDKAMSLEPMGGRPPSLSWHASLAQGRFAEAQERSNWQQGIDIAENNLDIALNLDDREALKSAIREAGNVSLSENSSDSRIKPLRLSFDHLYGPLLADFDSPERVLSLVRDVYRDENVQWPRKLHDLAMLSAYFGDPGLALEIKREEVRLNPVRLVALWYPVMSEVRRLPEFKELVTELNLVDYWRTYGWADDCRPTSEADFECS